LKKLVRKENKLVLAIDGVNFYVNQDTVLMEGWAQDRWNARTLQVFLVEENMEYTYLLADNQVVIHSEVDSIKMSNWIDEYCASQGYERQLNVLL
jgi:hypothetical protein